MQQGQLEDGTCPSIPAEGCILGRTLRMSMAAAPLGAGSVAALPAALREAQPAPWPAAACSGMWLRHVCSCILGPCLLAVVLIQPGHPLCIAVWLPI